MNGLSTARATLATFGNAYSVAVRLRETTGRNQYVVRTGNAFQPFRVTTALPANDEDVLVQVA
ncbi:hypothetical protein [uncultured Sphingomonas sp.]|uniref:hypothetical protein n=1 Tax=uncultured Sphingomonas sp. TaxID=158754 RepID=UPI00262590A7|nr:hypothetical protein [uncultured Sphingomonas sp.]